MQGIFGGIFWGGLLIVAGILLIVNMVFNLHLPVFKIMVALFFIYLGIMVLVRGWVWKADVYNDGSTAVFSNINVKPDHIEREYNVIFGQGNIDLGNLTAEDAGKTIRIATVFGTTTVTFSTELPIVIKCGSAFADVNLPDGSHISFGDYRYATDSAKNAASYIYVEADTVFGKCVFQSK